VNFLRVGEKGFFQIEDGPGKPYQKGKAWGIGDRPGEISPHFAKKKKLGKEARKTEQKKAGGRTGVINN